PVMRRLCVLSKRVEVILTGASDGLRKELLRQGVRPPLVNYERTIHAALKLRRGNPDGAGTTNGR
ncbi:MAG: hypothetical protein ACPHIA_09070, partial [Alphaproteobacteria bacterium]